MIHPTRMVLHAAEQHADTMRFVERERRAAACVADHGVTNGRPAGVAAPAVLPRRWLVRLLGVVPALRAKVAGSI